MANQDVERSGSTREVTPRQRAVAPVPVAPRRVSKPSPPRRVVNRKRVVKASSGRPNRTRVKATRKQVGNRDYTAKRQQDKKRAVVRRTESRKTIKKVAPVKPPKPTAKIVKPVAPPKPPPPSVGKYIAGDSTYQRQLAAYNKAMADFQADQGLAQTDYGTGYANTRRDIGLAKEEAAGDLEEDYASRGLLRSGLYNEGVGELNQQYQNQYTDLDKQRTSFLDQLGQELKKYQGEQSTQKQNAYAEAIRRRAERYNL